MSESNNAALADILAATTTECPHHKAMRLAKLLNDSLAANQSDLTMVDHSAHMGHKMDHSSHSGMGHSMAMAFNFDLNQTVLFSFWEISTVGGMVGSCLLVFLMGFLYEGLKVFREYLLEREIRTRKLQLQSDEKRRSLNSPCQCDNGDINEEHQLPIVKTVIRLPICSLAHLVQSLLHGVQMLISYFLMLIAMSFSVWLFSAVILGSGVGHFAFGWRKKSATDVNEHCH